MGWVRWMNGICRYMRRAATRDDVSALVASRAGRRSGGDADARKTTTRGPDAGGCRAARREREIVTVCETTLGTVRVKASRWEGPQELR